MAVRGMVKNGTVRLDNPKALADGTEVEVRPLKKGKPRPKARKPKAKSASLAERLANVVGRATGLPPDASVNHDHYLYGLPKRR